MNVDGIATFLAGIGRSDGSEDTERSNTALSLDEWASSYCSRLKLGDVLVDQETITADLHTDKVANFRFQPSVFFKLRPLSFKPSKKSTSSTSHLYCEKMFLQSSQPPTLAIPRATTPPPINSLSPDDKVLNPPRFLEIVKERPPIQVGFRDVWTRLPTAGTLRRTGCSAP